MEHVKVASPAIASFHFLSDRIAGTIRPLGTLAAINRLRFIPRVSRIPCADPANSMAYFGILVDGAEYPRTVCDICDLEGRGVLGVPLRSSIHGVRFTKLVSCHCRDVFSVVDSSC